MITAASAPDGTEWHEVNPRDDSRPPVVWRKWNGKFYAVRYGKLHLNVSTLGDALDKFVAQGKKVVVLP